MKIKLKVLVLCLVLSTTIFGKIGYINLDQIYLNSYPELEQSKLQIMQQKEKFEDELYKEEMKLQQEGAELSQRQETLTEEELEKFQKKRDEIGKKVKKYQTILSKLEEDFKIRIEQVNSQLNMAIEKVAKDTDTDVVIEQSVLLYVDKQTVIDLTPEIIDFLQAMQPISLD